MICPREARPSLPEFCTAVPFYPLRSFFHSFTFTSDHIVFIPDLSNLLRCVFFSVRDFCRLFFGPCLPFRQKQDFGSSLHAAIVNSFRILGFACVQDIRASTYACTTIRCPSLLPTLLRHSFCTPFSRPPFFFFPYYSLPSRSFLCVLIPDHKDQWRSSTPIPSASACNLPRHTMPPFHRDLTLLVLPYSQFLLAFCF